MAIPPTTAIVRLSDLRRWEHASPLAKFIPRASVSRGIRITLDTSNLVKQEPYLQRLSQLASNFPGDEPLIFAAFQLAWEGHTGQFRKSGEPYIEHTFAVAEICAGWGLGAQEIAAALCHDLREDGKINGQQVPRQLIVSQLGARVADLIEGITELGKEPEFTGSKPSHVDIFRKLLEYGSKDVASIFIKLADRLHNMRTLVYMSAEARKSKADETLQVYAKLADRMGIWSVKRELEDLSFSYLEPDLYKAVEKRRDDLARESRGRVGQIVENLGKKLEALGKEVTIILEQRHVYELHERTRRLGIGLPKLSFGDIWRVQVVLPERTDCHVALGIIQDTAYKPVQAGQSATLNFYADARPNGHRFLHSYVRVPMFGHLLIQLRDRKMFEHYQLGLMTSARKRKDSGWLRVLLDDLKREEAISDQEFHDLLSQHSVPIVVHSKKGDRIQVPFGSTPLEVAHKVHTDIFRHAAYAVVNGREVELATPLNDGDEVEVFTSPEAHPTIEWMDLLQSPGPLKLVRAFLKKRSGEAIIRDGLSALDRAGYKHYLTARGLLDTKYFAANYRESGLRSADHLLSEIGAGKVRAENVVAALMRTYWAELEAARENNSWLLTPFYLSLETRDRVGLSDTIIGPLRHLGYNVSDIFPVYPLEPGQVILVLGVDVAAMSVGGGRPAQIQRLQVETVAQRTIGDNGNLSRLRPEDVVRYLQLKIQRLSGSI